jgi:hypothetical protein
MAGLAKWYDWRAVRIPTDLLARRISLWRVAGGFLVACVTFACNNPFNDPYKDAHKAAATLQAAERQGLTLEDFRHLRQDLAAQVQLATEAAGDASKGSVNWNKASCYEMALAVDQITATTWQVFFESDDVTQQMKDTGHLNQSDKVECGTRRHALDRVVKDFNVQVHDDKYGCVYLNEVLTALWNRQDKYLNKAASGDSCP